MIAWKETLAAIPEELPAEEASPSMCAGVTVFNAVLPFVQSLKFNFLMNMF
jgi:D-arabinose 1-dehydrogenase-like Zn-dependent alcohol dehydrogenase